MIRPIEEWRKIRALVEKGLSLNKAAKQFALSYSHLQRRAAAEDWKLHYRGRPRTLDYPDGTRRVQMAREQTRRDAQEAELLLEARVAVFDIKKAELVAQRILAQHSIKMKVALSELVLQTAEDLRSPEVRPKDRALAMVALKTVCDRLFGWDREPEAQSMKLARTSGDDVPTAAINLALINTTPEQLAGRAKAQFDLDEHSGPSATDCNGQGMGPSVVAPQQPSAATHGYPIPEKKVPTQALDCQSALDAPAGHSPDSNPTPGSPAWHKKRLQELDRARAQWRRS